MRAQGKHACHLSRTVITHSLYQPTHTAFGYTKHRRATCDPIVGVQYLFGLSTPKVYRALAVASQAVGTYSTFSPLPCLNKAVYFLWHSLSLGFETKCLPVRK
jgi:hypothetical protein